MLWKNGGCTQMGGELQSGPQRTYDAVKYPNCSLAIKRAREAYEELPWYLSLIHI